MCMGYAKEIRAWGCDEARSQREIMMDAWSRAFEDADDESESSVSVLPRDSSIPAIEFQNPPFFHRARPALLEEL